ncbi:MAG: hypothetical protein DCF22_14940 [Leptolyngbya sp.]|nr:MAG: hypothetical protein DCF22_14940 [Leptolyngbya sp.]
MLERDQRDEPARITTLMDNLNNLKSKLNNFTVMDELGQPIGEIQDLILDDTHQLNLVIATSDAAESKPPVLLNGRRIKKVSVQTHAVFVDIVKADVNFLPAYTPSESSASRGDHSTNRAELNSSALLPSAQPPLSYSAASAAAAALMGESAIASNSELSSVEETISLEDDSFTSDSLFAESADNFAALDDDLFASDPLLPEPTDDFAALVEGASVEETISLEDDSLTSDSLFAESADNFAALDDDLFASDPLLPEPTDDFAALVEEPSMESIESLDDWLLDDPSTDQNDLATSLDLPDLELSLSEDFSSDSESASDLMTNNSLDEDWSDLVSPIDQPSLGYAPPSEDISLPDFSNDDLETPSFSLDEADEPAELGFASWEQASQPIETLSSDVLNTLADGEIESEFEDLPDINSLANDFAEEPLNENAEEFLLPSDFGEAGFTNDFTLESLSELDPPSEVPLDDFGFPDSSIPDNDLANQVPDLDFNLDEGLGEAEPVLLWADETESGELFELNLDDSFDPSPTKTVGGFELELAEEVADLNLLARDSTDLEFETDALGLDLETDSTDLEFETDALGLDLETDSTDLGFEIEAIAPFPDLDLALDDDFSGFVDQSVPIMDSSVSERPTSFIEVPMDAIAAVDSDNSANLELDTAFDVDLSLEDEFGAENFEIAETSDRSEAFTLQTDRFDPEPEIITSLTDLEFTDDLPTDDLPTDDLPTNDLANTFGDVADLSFVEEGEIFGDLTGLGSDLGESQNLALDNLFDNPTDPSLPSSSDEFNFSSPTMGFVDPAAGMAAASGILAGLAGLSGGVSRNPSSLSTEETTPPDLADVSDMSDAPAQDALNLNDPVISEPTISEQTIVSGQFKSPKVANAVMDAIAKTLGYRCKSIRIEIELDDSSLTQSYQDWLDQCSDL